MIRHQDSGNVSDEHEVSILVCDEAKERGTLFKSMQTEVSAVVFVRIDAKNKCMVKLPIPQASDNVSLEFEAEVNHQIANILRSMRGVKAN
jgi:hypothetical protein